MTTKTYRQVYGQPPPQSEPIPGREAEMVRNNAGGFAFKVDDWTRLERFLTLGTEGGTYYVCERKLTRDNAAAVRRCIESDGGRAVNRTREISESGRAAKNDPALFALAMAAAFGDADTKRAVAAALPCVARTGTHLLHFVSFMNDMRGWGRWAKRAVGRWYLERDRANLCLQLLKYRQRDGWTHRDVLRLSHPNRTTATETRCCAGLRTRTSRNRARCLCCRAPRHAWSLYSSRSRSAPTPGMRRCCCARSPG